METVVGGLFNAVAFAGAGFLFSKLNHTGYEKEIKRHNEAMEKLAKDKEKWYEQVVCNVRILATFSADATFFLMTSSQQLFLLTPHFFPT